MSAPFPPARIVTATDFSEGGDEAVAYAMALARRMDADLLVVHVVPRLSDVAFAMPESGYFQTPQWSAALDDMRQHARDGLEQLVEANTSEVDLQTVVLEGEPAEELVRYATQCDAQLIVVGTHGRKGLRRLLVGSVAERVVRLAEVPVVVVR